MISNSSGFECVTETEKLFSTEVFERHVGQANTFQFTQQKHHRDSLILYPNLKKYISINQLFWHFILIFMSWGNKKDMFA